MSIRFNEIKNQMIYLLIQKSLQIIFYSIYLIKISAKQGQIGCRQHHP